MAPWASSDASAATNSSSTRRSSSTTTTAEDGLSAVVEAAQEDQQHPSSRRRPALALAVEPDDNNGDSSSHDEGGRGLVVAHAYPYASYTCTLLSAAATGTPASHGFTNHRPVSIAYRCRHPSPPAPRRAHDAVVEAIRFVRVTLGLGLALMGLDIASLCLPWFTRHVHSHEIHYYLFRHQVSPSATTLAADLAGTWEEKSAATSTTAATTQQEQQPVAAGICVWLSLLTTLAFCTILSLRCSRRIKWEGARHPIPQVLAAVVLVYKALALLMWNMNFNETVGPDSSCGPEEEGGCHDDSGYAAAYVGFLAWSFQSMLCLLMTDDDFQPSVAPPLTPSLRRPTATIFSSGRRWWAKKYGYVAAASGCLILLVLIISTPSIRAAYV